MSYTYCIIDTPDEVTLEAYVDACKEQVYNYTTCGGVFSAATQGKNIAGTQVILFTEGDFPESVQNATGYIAKTQGEINALRDTSEWTATE